MKKDCRLSLCMIVKNEENCISRCLNSVKDVVDEMIIVDTGSTDRTVEICSKFGAKVLNFPWNGSFADARNYGIDRATGDWILWLDADEELDPDDVTQIKKHLLQDEFDILTLRLINFYGDIADMDKVSEIAHHRIFRNGIGIKFVNKIHEVLHAPEELHLTENGRIGFLNLKLYHYGYLNDVVSDKDKHNRNLEMLEKEISLGEATPWTYYYIAAEYFQMEQYAQAFKKVNLAIAEFLKSGQIPPPAILYKLKYSILVNAGSFDEAYPGIQKAILLYPDYVELWYLMGLILFQKQQFEETIKVFDECLDLGETNSDYLIVKGIGSFHALYFKGQCLEKLNKIEDALRCYLKALSLSINHPFSLEALEKLVYEHENLIHYLIKEEFDQETSSQLIAVIESLKSNPNRK